jgi:hypothetical protein
VTAADGTRTGVADRPPPRIRTEVVAFLELLGVCAVAITQPVLSVFGDGADVFLNRRASAAVVILFALGVALLPAIALWVLEVVAGLVSARLRRVVHVAALALLVGAAALQAVKEATELERAPLLAVFAAVAALAAVLVVRVSAVRLWLRFLAAFTVVALVTFLLGSQIRPLLGGDETATRGTGVAAAPAPVVFLVLDELPTTSLLDGSGRVDRELFPNIAALAGGATWYRNSTAVSTETTKAVPALLTGRHPEERAVVPTASELPDNLFTVLDRGYDVSATEVITRLCPDRTCGDAPRPSSSGSLRDLLDSAGDVWRERVSPSREETAPAELGGFPYDPDPAAKIERFVDGLEASDVPTLDFLHVLLPHQPFHYLPSGRQYQAPLPPDGNFLGIWADEVAAEAGRQRHLVQLQFTDRMVGRVVDRLRELGTYDETLLVVTADHGAAFVEGHNIRALDDETYPDMLWTPLFVKAPRQAEGRIDDRHVRSVDVLPTVADHLDLDLGFRVDGRSALEAPGDGSPELRALPPDLGFGETGDDRSYRTFDLEAGFDAVLRAQAAPPASGDPGLRLFRTGDHGDLVGRPVAGLEGAPAEDVVAELETPDRLDIAPDADELPAWTAAWLPESVEGDVAVAVDGTVAAVRPLRLDSDRRRLWALLPEQLLPEGRSDVTLYLIDDSAERPSLRPLELSANP